MVELSDAPSYPEAVMIKLPHTPVAGLAMLGPVRYALDAAFLAASVWRDRQVPNVTK